MERGNGGDVQDLGQAFFIPHPSQAGAEHVLPPGSRAVFKDSVFKDSVLGWPVDAVCISPARFWGRQGHISAELFAEIAPRCNHCVTAHLGNLAELQDVWGWCV